MSDTLTIPMPGNTLKLVIKNWGTIVSVGACLIAIGMARGRYSTVEARVDALEQLHPDATAAIAHQNAQAVAAVTLRIDQISKDVADTRVDVGRLCTRFGLQPISRVDGLDVYQPAATHSDAPARP
jgi:hypothetical protein